MNGLEELKSARVDRRPPALGAVNAIAAGRRRRHRRFTVAGGALVLVIGAAAVLGVTGLSGGGDAPSTVSPAAPPARAVASVDGIDVTWLPEDYGADSSSLQPNVPSYGPVSWYQEFHDSRLADPNPASPARRSAVGFALMVSRGKVIGFTKASQDPSAIAGGYKVSSLSVRGHRGLLLSRAKSTLFGPASYRLIWLEQDSLALEVDAFGGPTLAQAERLANSLVVHESPTPQAETKAAVAQIRDAFNRAYTAPNPPAVALGAVEDGASLSGTLQKLTELLPNTVRTSHVTTSDVVFLGSAEALVHATVSYQWMGQPTVNSIPQTARLIDGQWKVSRISFCSTISAGGVTCPPVAGH